jgi:hypothetical protein
MRNVRFAALAGCALVAIGLLARSVCGRSHGYQSLWCTPRFRVCSGTKHCETINASRSNPTGDEVFRLDRCVPQDRLETALHIWWDSSSPLPVRFQWVAAFHEDDVFPVHGAVTELMGCQVFPGRAPVQIRTYADLLYDPAEYHWATPSPENVPVPFEGEVIIDQDDHATASMDTPESTYGAVSLGEVPTATVRVDRGQRDEVFSGLRAGSMFAWGDREATVVRLVEPGARAIGWVEVALSDRAPWAKNLPAPDPEYP